MVPETLPVPTLHMIWDKPLFLFIRQVRRFYPFFSNRYAGHPASPSSSLLGPLVDDSVRSWLMFQVTLGCLLEAVALTVAGVNANWIVSRLMPEMDSNMVHPIMNLPWGWWIAPIYADFVDGFIIGFKLLTHLSKPYRVEPGSRWSQGYLCPASGGLLGRFKRGQASGRNRAICSHIQ